MLFYLKALATFMPCHCATWQTCLHCQAFVLDWNFWEERFVSFDKKNVSVIANSQLLVLSQAMFA